jgi:transposase InsO family protein
VKAVTIRGLCEASGLSRQGYYQGRRDRQRAARDEEHIVEAVRRERLQQPRIGTRKLQVLLGADGLHVGRDTLFRILGEQDLLVAPKQKKARTTYYDQSLPVYRNLLYGLQPTRPHHVWVSDITFISTDEGFVYLSLITDLVSRRIVGWNASATNEAAETIKALHMAISALPADRWPIHHSDRGSQYCCHDYVSVLTSRGLPISMTEQNHCYENCYAERVNGILKDEFNLDHLFRTRAQARVAIKQAISTYNTRRPHTSLAMRTPEEIHQLAA